MGECVSLQISLYRVNYKRIKQTLLSSFFLSNNSLRYIETDKWNNRSKVKEKIKSASNKKKKEIIF